MSDYANIDDLSPESEACSEFPQATPVAPKCDPTSGSTTTDGGSAVAFMDQAPASEMTLIGRRGSKLTKFVGDGFIKILNGVAIVADSLPLSVKQLFHKYDEHGVLQDAAPYPFKTVTDSKGNVFAVRGLIGKDSIEVWNSTDKVFEQRAASDFPMQKLGELPKASCVELTGFIPAGECDTDQPRPITALLGNGLVVLTQDEDQKFSECGGCPEDYKVSKASVVSFPKDDLPYYVRYNRETGMYFEAAPDLSSGKSAYEIWLEQGNFGTEADFLASLVGSAGENGIDGATASAGLSAYEVWIADGNVGTETDFLNSLAGTDGTDGTDGVDLTGTLDTTSETLQKAFTFFAPMQSLFNANQNADLPLAASTRADTDWAGSVGSSLFVYSAQADRVQIDVHAHLKIADASTVAAVDAAPTIDLLRSGVVVASFTAEQSQLNDNTESSIDISYTDANPAAASTYSLKVRQESAVTETVPIVAGYVTATAFKDVEVVTAVSFTPTP